MAFLKLELKLKDKDSRGVMEGLRQITSHKIDPSGSNPDPQLPDERNEFYCHFDKTSTLEAPLSPPLVI